jgi:hypothetical protein
MITQYSGLDKFIEIFIEGFYFIRSIPAAPLLSMRNPVGFFMGVSMKYTEPPFTGR